MAIISGDSSSGGDDSGSNKECSPDGKIYTNEGVTSVSVQQNFKNKCHNAEKLIIKGAISITIQDGTAFKNSKLKEIEMSSSSSISIQDDSFENLESLQSLSLSSVSITISGSCFKGTGLSSISIKATSSVTIQDKAFRNCKSLKTVELSGASVTVEGLTFSYCTELNSFTIEAKSSANIQNNAFCGCAKLTEEDIHITAVSTNINKDAFSCDKDDGDDGDGNKELEPIKYILPVKKGGKLRPIDITLVDKEGGPSVSSLKLLEDLPIRIHSKLPELSNIDLRNFKINLNYDQTKYHVDKSDLPVSLQKLVNEKDTNGKKGINIALIAGVAAAAVVVVVIIIAVVVVVIKKKKSKDEKSTEQSTAEVV